MTTKNQEKTKAVLCAAGVILLGIGVGVAYGWPHGLATAGVAIILDSRFN